tara:strand:- start:12840 stop:14042 length:1203 start_codon:yes stop_codon:yes gene_type:complete
MRKNYKLAVLTSHPIQYQCPLWKRLSEHPEIDLTVYYCSDFGIKEQFEPEFGVKYKWDLKLLDGYKSIFLKNYSPKPSFNPIWGKINPGIAYELIKKKYDGIFVHGHFATTNLIAFITSKLTGTQVLLRAIASNFYDNIVQRNKIILTAKKLYLKIVYKFLIDSFLSIGSRNKDFFISYGIANEKIFHCPYAVDNKYFFKKSESFFKNRKEIRKEHGINDSTTVLLFASKLITKKCPLDLLRAYKKINDLPNKQLLIIGDGHLRKTMEEFVHKEKLNNVSFLGFQNQENMVKYYSISDIFVRTDLPDKGDWGATVNESLACSLPVISTNALSSQADLIKNGENGYVIEIGDTDKLASHLRELIENPKKLFDMRKKAKEIMNSWSYEEDVIGILNALKNHR